MYNQRSYQVAYANFVMDQHQDIPSTSQNTSPLLPNNPIVQVQQNSVMEFKKPVRTRISFSYPQQVLLETEFQGSAYIYKSRRIEIANRLGIEEKHVKVWFQNRRMKWKRETLQHGNKATMPHRSLKYRPQHGTFKKQPQFAVLRKAPEDNARKGNPLPVHKPMAAQLVKGLSLMSANVPKVFKPQLIVQLPVPVTVPHSMQPSTSQIYRPTSPTSIYHHLRQQPTQQQLQNQAQQLLHQVEQQAQQQRPIKQESEVQHKLQQQPVRVQHQLQQQPPQQPMHQVPEDTILPQVSTLTSAILASNPSPMEYKTLNGIATVIEGIQNPECSEESVDLDRYLNDVERRVEALKSNQRENQRNQQEQQQQQHQPIMNVPEDLGDCVEEFEGLSNFDMDQNGPKMDDDFDMKELLDDLDRYVSYPGTAPELDFDDSLFDQDLDFANCPILEYDPTLPLVDFSFDDWTLVGH